jgi:hypothetical protein
MARIWVSVEAHPLVNKSRQHQSKNRAPTSFEVVPFSDAAFRQVSTWRTSPETKFAERSSDAVQAYAMVRAGHGKRRALPSPKFSLDARIPTLPNRVQEGDFNLASTALQN